MLIEDALRALQEPWCRRTARAVQRSIRFKRHAEEYRERSLRVASGQSNVADGRHASHTLPSSGEEVKRASPASIRLLFCGHEGVNWLRSCGASVGRNVGMWRDLARPAGLEPATPGLEGLISTTATVGRHQQMSQRVGRRSGNRGPDVDADNGGKPKLPGARGRPISCSASVSAIQGLPDRIPLRWVAKARPIV